MVETSKVLFLCRNCRSVLQGAKERDDHAVLAHPVLDEKGIPKPGKSTAVFDRFLEA